MAYEIKIYGEITPHQDADVSDYGFFNLKSLESELEKASGQDVRVRINSFGGDVNEGFAIYDSLRRYASEKNAHITTLAEGQCASIATVFFLAGDERILTKHTDPFVHDAWVSARGNAKDLRNTADLLEKVSARIAQHYAEHTELSFEEAKALMDAETSITPEECVKLRFATKVEEVKRPVALQNIINKPINKMSENKDKEKGLFAKFKALLKEVEGGNNIQNKILFTADQKEVDFFELEDNDEVVVGAKATIDGKNADGEVTMADGKTFKFKDGTLDEIVEAEDENAQKIADLEAQIEALKASNTEAVNKLTNEKNDFETKYNSVLADLEKKNSIIEKFKALETEFKAEKHDPNKDEPNKDEKKVSSAVENWKKNKVTNQNKK